MIPALRSRSSRRRGITLVETLAAALIVTISMTGMVGVLMAVSNTTNRTSQATVALSIARRRIEEAHNLGFYGVTEGSSVQYFDVYGNGGQTTKTSNHFFSATTAVSTSPSITNGTPDKTATRTVIVTVKRLSDNTVLETTGTLLVWGGI